MNFFKHLKRGLLVLTAALALQLTTQNKYALILSGNSYYRHQVNISTAYQTFLENGFEKIYVLDTNGQESANYPVYGTANRQNLEDVINKLKQEMDSLDLFFLYVTDHGNRISHDFMDWNKAYSTIVLYNESQLSEEELGLILNPLKPKLAVYLFDECYSGGFADYFGYGNIIAIASVDAKKGSHSQMKNSVGYFFMKALAGDITADSDKNRKISIKEAFDYMMKRYSYSINGLQKPFINSELDPSKVYIK